jgi:hypothetical protein
MGPAVHKKQKLSPQIGLTGSIQSQKTVNFSAFKKLSKTISTF